MEVRNSISKIQNFKQSRLVKRFSQGQKMYGWNVQDL